MTKPDAVKAFGMLMEKAEKLHIKNITFQPYLDSAIIPPFFNYKSWSVILEFYYGREYHLPKSFDAYEDVTRFLEGS